MKEPIKLYLDKVHNDGANGETTNGDKMLYNLKALGDGWFDAYTTMLSEYNNATIFAPAGRFLSISTGSLDSNACSMHLLDLMDNEDITNHFAKQSMGNDALFLAACKLIEYKKKYNDFILVEGDIPT